MRQRLPPPAGPAACALCSRAQNGAVCAAISIMLAFRTVSSRRRISTPRSLGDAGDDHDWASNEVERDVEHARVKLNEALAALKPPAEFDLVTGHASDFGRRGVCATTDGKAARRPGVFHHAQSFRPALRANLIVRAMRSIASRRTQSRAPDRHRATIGRSFSIAADPCPEQRAPGTLSRPRVYAAIVGRNCR